MKGMFGMSECISLNQVMRNKTITKTMKTLFLSFLSPDMLITEEIVPDLKPLYIYNVF